MLKKNLKSIYGLDTHVWLMYEMLEMNVGLYPIFEIINIHSSN